MPKYLVKQSLDYGNRRVEAGEVVDDIPAKSVSWLKEQGIIEPFDGVSKKKNDRIGNGDNGKTKQAK